MGIEITITTRADRARARHARIYRPLNDIKKEFRVFKIVSPTARLDSKHQLQCQTKTVSLYAQPLYHCISYRWGASYNTETILLDGTELEITTGLAAALKAFQNNAEYIDLWFWADAICINQKDVEERSSQVAIMYDIYAQAVEVRAWVKWPYKGGQDMQDLVHQRLQEAILLICEFMQRDTDVKLMHNFECITTLIKMFENKYWQRAWILQELAVAKKVSLYYGGGVYDMSSDRIRRIHAGLGTVAARLDGNAGNRAPVHSPGQVPRFEQHSLYIKIGQAMNSTYALNVGRPTDLAEAATLLVMVNRKSSNMHDYVYSLLGMTNHKLDIRPDYTRPWRDVYASFTFQVLSNARSLEALRWASTNSELPSWVVDVSRERNRVSSMLGKQGLFDAYLSQSFHLRRSGDAIVVRGLLLLPIADMATDKDIARTRKSNNMSVFKARVLTYMRMYDKAAGMTSSDQELLKAGIVPELLRTLVQDVYSEEDDVMADRFVAAGLLSSFRRMKAAGLSQRKLIMDHWLLGKDKSCSLSEWLERDLEGLAYFVTAKGYSGMGDVAVRIGDMIAVLEGCRLPFCLRPVVLDGKICYKLIGPCYVNGMMDGEVPKALAKEIQEPGAFSQAYTLSDAPRTSFGNDEITIV